MKPETQHLIKQLETEIAIADKLFLHHQETANMIGMYKQKLIADKMVLERSSKEKDYVK